MICLLCTCIQVTMIQNTFGERWWEMHKARLCDARLVAEMHEYTRLKLKEKQKMKDKEVITDAMILQRMGKVRYYLTPWRREVEKGRMLRMVAIENSLDTYCKKYTRGEVV